MTKASDEEMAQNDINQFFNNAKSIQGEAIDVVHDKIDPENESLDKDDVTQEANETFQRDLIEDLDETALDLDHQETVVRIPQQAQKGKQNPIKINLLGFKPALSTKPHLSSDCGTEENKRK